MGEQIPVGEELSENRKNRIYELEAEVGRLRSGLFECARAAGEDVSDGVPTSPPIDEWAVRAVEELRRDYDECPTPEALAERDAVIARVREWAESELPPQYLSMFRGLLDSPGGDGNG